MTAEAKRIVEDFRALPDDTKREVLAELMRISGGIDYPIASARSTLKALSQCHRYVQ